MPLPAARLPLMSSSILTKRYKGTVICIGTGPSLAQQQIETAKGKGWLFGCNNVWELTALAVHYACNLQWWDHYWPQAQSSPGEKWTTNAEAARKYGLEWIAEKNAPGLSTDDRIVHHGHGSGYTLVNLAYLMGASRIVLLGYDLKYAPDYSGYSCSVGSSPRHYFGEYPEPLQHWPKVKVHNGVHVELLDLYRSVAKQGAVEILNATHDSAIDCFPRVSIDAV